jgi:hypothetical protein
MNATLSSLFENPLPQSIINHEESGMLDLVWQDGRERVLSQ